MAARRVMIDRGRRTQRDTVGFTIVVCIVATSLPGDEGTVEGMQRRVKCRSTFDVRMRVE